MKKLHSLFILCAVVYGSLTFLSSPETYAQLIRCCKCNYQITGDFLYIRGNYYHNKCFVCKHCGQPIKDKYSESLGDFYHPECLKIETTVYCEYCKQPIESDVFVHEMKSYHRSCYDNYVVQRCAVCNEPIYGEYLIDIYGNKYHSEHSVLDICDNCGRIISNQMTKGGVIYKDGRHICNLCVDQGIFADSVVKSLFNKVLDKLNGFGINLNKDNISIQAVDRDELKRISGFDKFNQLEGFCKTSSRDEYKKGKQKSRKFNHKIYVLNGLDALNLEAIIAHELMHAWLLENTTDNQSPEDREGTCNFISYVYLMNLDSDREIGMLLKRMEANPDPVYGKGFLNIRKKYTGKQLSCLLEDMKNTPPIENEKNVSRKKTSAKPGAAHG